MRGAYSGVLSGHTEDVFSDGRVPGAPRTGFPRARPPLSDPYRLRVTYDDRSAPERCQTRASGGLTGVSLRLPGLGSSGDFRPRHGAQPLKGVVAARSRVRYRPGP
jgi:hypothetical protein